MGKVVSNSEKASYTHVYLPRSIAGVSICSGTAVGTPLYIRNDESKFFIGSPLNGCRADGSSGNPPPWGRSEITENDFSRVLLRTKAEIRGLQISMKEGMSELGSQIFNSHLVMLEDEAFSGRMFEKIQEGAAPEAAVADVVNRYIELFNNNGNDAVREKIHDVKDVGRRLLRNLGNSENSTDDYTGKIILTENILPSDLIKMSVQGASGFLFHGKNAAAHIAILAQSLDIPVIIIETDNFETLAAAGTLILDGHSGTVIINPTDEELENYLSAVKDELCACSDSYKTYSASNTKDGERISLYANVNLLSDIYTAKSAYAEGIGLYRSEMPFIIRNSFLTEEEQYRIYSELFSKFGDNNEIIFRTLDIGGDKNLSALNEQAGFNSFLGLRAIRFSLRHKEIFAAQLRAMLRAGYGRQLYIMFPLISSLEEFIEAKDFVYHCIASLTGEGIMANRTPKIGAMVELPSAVEIIDKLAEQAEFVSIGTNDLIQYLLGIDRTDKFVAHYYTHYHPSVIRTVGKIIRACGKKQCDVSVCGEAAADIPMLRFMIGMGLRKISIDPKKIGEVREAVGTIDTERARDAAKKAMRASLIDEIREILSVPSA